jgi:hypothetical protein
MSGSGYIMGRSFTSKKLLPLVRYYAYSFVLEGLTHISGYPKLTIQYSKMCQSGLGNFLVWVNKALVARVFAPIPGKLSGHQIVGMPLSEYTHTL